MIMALRAGAPVGFLNKYENFPLTFSIWWIMTEIHIHQICNAPKE